jgi:hypothetical protein
LALTEVYLWKARTNLQDHIKALKAHYSHSNYISKILSTLSKFLSTLKAIIIKAFSVHKI